MFDSSRQAASQRLSEVRQILDVIKQMESSNPLIPDSADVLMLRGLFFVHLYAALEFSVNGAVERFLTLVTAARIQMTDLEPAFLTLALDSQLTSLSSSSEGKNRWAKRLKLMAKQCSLDEVTVSHSVIALSLSNIWEETLVELFACFNITSSIVPSPALQPYINEIVNKRNQVAHGRESPMRVGAGTRSPDLQIRLTAITDIITHLSLCFENHIKTAGFVKKNRRSTYTAAILGQA